MTGDARVRQADMSDLDDVRTLLREYEATLPFALAFQGFDEELASLPGDYAPPGGALLVAEVGGELAGCVALRDLGGGTCELKRLFVRPRHRGARLGLRLTETMLAEARARGYARMRLDTTPGMEAAQAIYARLGFRDVPAYTANPVPGARFMELEL